MKSGDYFRMLKTSTFQHAGADNSTTIANAGDIVVIEDDSAGDLTARLLRQQTAIRPVTPFFRKRIVAMTPLEVLANLDNLL